MKLKDINEIKEDGLVVFMPSGIQATLFNEGKKILVKYYNLKEDRYTIKDFKKVMAEGIEVFSDQPTIPQQSVLMESEGPKLASYQFSFIAQTEEDVLVTDDDGNEYELSCDTTSKETLHDDLEEQMDLIVAPELCEYEITGTEIVGFQYDEETSCGSFEFNIFYEDDMDESVLMESEGEYKLSIITGRDRDAYGETIKTSFKADNDVAAFVYVLKEYGTCASSYFNGDYEDDELDEEELENKQKVLAAAESGENQDEAIAILADWYNNMMDPSDYYDDILTITAPDGHIVFEDETFDDVDWDAEDYDDDIDWEDEDDMDESILDMLHKKGYIRDSLMEAYEKVKNPEGQVFKALKDKKKEYITADYKKELLTCLDRIARDYPNVKVRQQALTFMDEINMQEYWDIKAVKDFCKKHLEVLDQHVNESIEDYTDPQGKITLRDAEKEFNQLVKEAADIRWQGPKFIDITGLENACPAFTCINWDDIVELIRSWGFTVYEDETEEPAIALDKNITEEQLKQMIEQDAIENGYNESLNEDENSIAEEIRRGNKSGQDPKFGNWLLETSLDEKWEQLTNDMKLYLMDGIADFVQQGSLKEQDLLLEIDPMTGLTKEDVQSLEMFDQEEIDYTFSSEDLQLNAYISYEVKTDLDTPKDMEESLDEDSDLGLYIQTTGELYKKHIQDKKDVDWDALVNDGIAMYKEEIENKEFSPEEIEEAKEYLKNYFTESVNEDIYLKKENGEEVGPFENQEAEEQYIKDQKDNGNEEEYEEIIKEENMSKKNEDCYKVYNTIDPDSQPLSFNSWNEVEDHLNKEWGDYKVSMAKENAEFGTDEDRDNFMGNFEIAIEPIEIPVEEIPAEGIELEAEPVIKPEAEVCPDCEETEVCPECGKEPCECETEEPINDLEEDFEDEHIGKSEEEPIEEPEQEETEEEINTPEEAADKVDEIDDALDSLEDFLNTLIGDEELTPEEEQEIQEMCMTKLPDPKTVKEKDKKEKEEEKNEEFSDNMGMLTDINDLDFPDALANTVETKEDGSLYRLGDLAKEIEEVKSSMEEFKNSFKSELATMLQDLKNDLKLSVNNVETKVQDTKSAVDNLTSEEEDLADIEFDQEEAPVEEQGEEAPEEGQEEPSQEESEEEFEESLKGNRVYECIKAVIKNNKHPKGMISIPTIAEKLREDYGIDTNTRTKFGQQTYNQVANIVSHTSLKENVVDVVTEERERKKAILGEAANWLGGGLMSKLEQQSEQAKWENLEKVKQEIDQAVQKGADAEQLKDQITLSSEDENEEKQAKDYAVQKLQQKNMTTESLLAALKNTANTSTLRNIRFQ